MFAFVRALKTYADLFEVSDIEPPKKLMSETGRGAGRTR